MMRRMITAAFLTVLLIGGGGAADLAVDKTRTGQCPGINPNATLIPFVVPAGRQVTVTSVRLINQVTHVNLERRLATAPSGSLCNSWRSYRAGAGDIFAPEGVDYSYFLHGSYFGCSGVGYCPMEVVSTKYTGTSVEVEMAKGGSPSPHVRVTVNW